MKKSLALIAVTAVLFASAACGKNKGEKEMSSAQRPVVEMETSLGTIKIEMMSDIAPKTVENFIGLATGTKEWTDPKSNKKVSRPFYDGLIFHRVINDFMIQGGCPLGNGTGGPGYSFEDECYAAGDEVKGKIDSDELAAAVFQEIIIPYLRSTPNPDEELMSLVRECQMKQSGQPIMRNPVEYYMQKTGRTEPFYAKGKLLAPVEYGTICMANSGPNTNGSQFFIVTKKDGCSWLNGKHTVFGRIVEGMDVAEKIQNAEKGANDKPVKDIVIKKVSVLK
ncbi:MAG: peptidylprolyl isomerase [Spirochaetota bacterium]